MKNKNLIPKNLSIWISLLAAICIFSSCTGNTPTDAKSTAEDQNETKFDSKDTEADAQFLVNAAEMNTELISFSALVVAKAKNEQVKQLGIMIEESHSKALRELKDLAKNKTITLPTLASNDSNEEYKELNNKAANEFDVAYIDKVVQNHKEGIEKFEKAASSATDSDIKMWATNMLPTLRTHLDQALKCEKDLALMDDIKTRK